MGRSSESESHGRTCGVVVCWEAGRHSYLWLMLEENSSSTQVPFSKWLLPSQLFSVYFQFISLYLGQGPLIPISISILSLNVDKCDLSSDAPFSQSRFGFYRKIFAHVGLQWVHDRGGKKDKVWYPRMCCRVEGPLGIQEQARLSLLMHVLQNHRSVHIKSTTTPLFLQVHRFWFNLGTILGAWILCIESLIIPKFLPTILLLTAQNMASLETTAVMISWNGILDCSVAQQ